MKTTIDPRIKVDTSTGKKIAQVIHAEIKASLADNKAHYDLCKRSMNQYNQVTKWMESGKECDKPWKGAADYFVAMTEWVVDTVWSRVLSSLFGQEPYMQATGESSNDVPKQEGVTDFVDMVFREIIDLYQNSR
jgi:hypothetical protein